ncbi:MAG: fumarate hydratase [Anaerolineaceae bacterium]|nr:fumarate hydratase [Anaerolineaceae bacterium]
MLDLTAQLIELMRLASTDLPADVEQALNDAHAQEALGSPAQGVLDSILLNTALAREHATPICQDTGTPIFYVKYPLGWSTRSLGAQIRAALIDATKSSFLRPNAVETLSGVNTGDNSGDAYYPVIHFEEVEGTQLTIDLMLKGGGCENVGAQYTLPDVELNAGRDLAGVRKVVLHAVHKAQGRGCAPGVLGVAVGGDRSSSNQASKDVLLRPLSDRHSDPELADYEEQLTREANTLGIGPMGFGGATTLLGTKIIVLHRLPASYFVSISYMCWAFRRRRMIVEGTQVTYA